MSTRAVMRKGKAWYSWEGTPASQPRGPGKAMAREGPDTRRVLKKPNTTVHTMAKAGLQLAKMTRATAIQP